MCIYICISMLLLTTSVRSYHLLHRRRWELFVSGVWGVVLVVCVCVGVEGFVLCRCVCVCVTLAFARYCFTPRLLCTNQSSVYYPLLLALPALLLYYFTSIAQYTTRPPTPLVYAIHPTILVMPISCKCQV